MKKLILVAYILLLAGNMAYTQWYNDTKRDYQWIMGWGDQPPPLGGSILNFNTTPLSTISFTNSFPMLLRGDNGAICDAEGKLLFFTNGRRVCDKFGEVMPNGDSLNYGDIWNWYQRYYPVLQGIIVLPFPGHDSLFMIIHQKLDYLNGIGIIPVGLLYSIVDMTLNNGLGNITNKNIPIILDTLNLGCLTACRHGNGRDWWLLNGEFNQQRYYRLLLDPEGIHLVGIQTIGKASLAAEQGVSCFSPDGRYYVQAADSFRHNTPVRVDLFSFNRCTGLLSDYIDLGNFIIPEDVIASSAFSSNSRFLYINSSYSIWQYDLQSGDINASKTLVGAWDGTIVNVYMKATFEHSQLAPDASILISCDGTKYIHVIEHPDLPGTACSFIQRKFTMPRNSWEFPNYPHFRLGRWEGSPCDNLYSGIEDKEKAEETLKVFPNPARDEIRINVGQITAGMPSTLEIYALLSGKLEEIPVSPFQGMVKWKVTNLPNGMYSFVLKSDGNILGTGKFAVIR